MDLNPLSRAPLSRLTPTLAAGSLLLAGTALLAPAPAAEAASTVTTATNGQRISIGSRTESDLALGMTINDGKSTRYPSSTGPTGLAGTVTDVNVRVKGFSHERPRDVDMMLVSPNGKAVMLMSDVGGTNPVQNIDLTFDDEATAPIDPANALQASTWKPSNEDSADTFDAPAPPVTPDATLSALDGQRADGAWSVYVFDDSFDYFGSISEIWIDITTTGPDLYPSTVSVSGLPSTVTDVDVDLIGLRHNWAYDVDLLLVGPQGQQAMILSDAGIFATNVQVVDLTFDDEAATELPDRIITGSYRPTNRVSDSDVFAAPAPVVTGSSALSAFDGTDPNGVWSLYVADDREKDAGTLEGWTLRITTETPVTSPADSTHPRITSIRPAGGAKKVRRGASVVARPDEPLAPASVSKATAYVVAKGTRTHVRATVTWDAQANRIVIDPRRKLKAATTYRVIVTAEVTDLAGNALDQNPGKAGNQRLVSRFTTA